MSDPHHTRIHIHLTATQVLIGAIPAILGIILMLLHARTPLLGPEHQGVLLVAMIVLVQASSSIWLLLAVDSAARDCQTRSDEIQRVITERADADARRLRSLTNSVHTGCKRLGRIERRLDPDHEQSIPADIQHLHTLIIEGAGWDRQAL